MKLGLLPCEIYHREFDAKLILAARMAKMHNFKVIIGYDKYFNQLIKHLPPALLLEKSCSSIMWEGRIKPTKEKGGTAIVNDEEGFNDLGEENEIIFTNRLDLHAAEQIDLYSCWGEIDYKFWGKIQALQNKIEILGNSRSDLVNSIGRRLYADQANSLKEIYGDYVLASDNFGVEKRDHITPIFNISEEKRNIAEKKLSEIINSKKENREIFADMICQSAQKMTSTQFIIRPHPVADSKWWDCRFSKERNVHVIYHLNIDPWIIGAKALISMGCTTAMQAAIAGTPIIEIEKINNNEKIKNTGLGYQFTCLKASSAEKMMEHIHTAMNEKSSKTFRNLDLLDRYWHKCQTASATTKFSDLFNNLGKEIDKSMHEDLYRVLNMAHRFYMKNPIKFDQTKWISPTIKQVNNKFKIISSILNEQELKIQKISNGLFFVSKSE